MSRRRAVPRPRGLSQELDAIVSELDARSRQDRSYHDHERSLARGRSGSVDLELAAGSATEIRHGLGRRPQGWRIVDIVNPTAVVLAAPIYRRVADRFDAEVITLYNPNAVAVTVRLEVF